MHCMLTLFLYVLTGYMHVGGTGPFLIMAHNLITLDLSRAYVGGRAYFVSFCAMFLEMGSVNLY